MIQPDKVQQNTVGEQLARKLVELKITSLPKLPESGFDSRIVTAEFSRPELLEASFSTRIQNIVGHHDYVSFDLGGNGRAVHITRVTDEQAPGFLIHVVSPGVVTSGARYSELSQRVFVDIKGKFEDLIHKTGDASEVHQLLRDLEERLENRAERPLIINVSPQGFHENHPRREKLGLQDTGGQDKYINDFARTAAAMGFQIVNVNRAGPNHPINKDCRCGMHYGHTGIDLLFVRDGNPGFVAKEDMYPELEDVSRPLSALPKDDKVFFPLARDLAQQLVREPKLAGALLIGHYADGISVALNTADILETTENRRPKVWGIAHSTGAHKEESIRNEGKEVAPYLRIPERKAVEKLIFSRVDVLISTSGSMTHSHTHDYGREPDFLLTPGVNEDLFRPRPAHRSRTDAKYDEVWQELSKLTPLPLATLQADNAFFVMEVSRTSPAKGKDTVIRAFAESIRPGDNKFLIINVTDVTRTGLSAEELELGTSLRKLVEDLGVRDRVLMRNDFPNHLVARMSQIANVYVSAASLEPWGMGVQQAAACALPIVSTNVVPAATEVLKGQTPINPLPGTPGFVQGHGAFFFRPGDYKAAAAAINVVADEPHLAREIGEHAHKATIPRFTWRNLTRAVLEEVGGYSFDPEGQVDRT